MNQPIVVRRLNWDPWNEEHIARHEATTEEVWEVSQSKFIVRDTYQGRLMLIGPTKSGRVLVVILDPLGDDVYYPITAYAASRKLRRLYSEETEGR